MKKTLLLFILFSLLLLATAISPTKAQTGLTADDIAIVGFNFDDPDQLAFIPLVNLEAGTQITFTDNGWLAAGDFRANEGAFTWTAPSLICAGEMVSLSPAGGSFAFSSSGDQILAYKSFVNNLPAEKGEEKATGLIIDPALRPTIQTTYRCSGSFALPN